MDGTQDVHDGQRVSKHEGVSDTKGDWNADSSSHWVLLVFGDWRWQ